MRMTVADVMTNEVVTVTAAAPFKEIAEALITGGIGAVPVTDDDNHVIGMVPEADVGIVSRRDLIKVFLRRDTDIEQDIRQALRGQAGVTVTDGVVTLTGAYAERSQAVTAVRLAENIDGVVTVHDELAWKHDDIVDLAMWGGA